LLSAVQTVTIKNSGSGYARLSAPMITGANANLFSIAENGCGASLAPGGSCQISLQFETSSFSQSTASLSIDQANGVPYFSVALSGQGGGPQLIWSPTNLQFGEVPIGQTAQLSLSVTNAGTNSAALSTPSLMSTSVSTAFAIASNGCSSSLAAGSTCQLVVSFTPTVLGTAGALLQAADTGNAQSYQVQILGTAAVRQFGCCRVLRSPGVTPVTTPATPAAITGMTGQTQPPQAVPEPQLFIPSFLPGQASGQQASNAQPSQQAGEVSDASMTPAAHVEPDPVPEAITPEPTPPIEPIHAKTVEAVTTLVATPESVKLEASQLSSPSEAVQVVIKNTGTVPAWIGNLNVQSSVKDAFSVLSSNCSGRMLPLASCHVSVTYTPTANAPSDGIIVISARGLATPLQVPLHGTVKVKTPIKK
jgi:hypothetical protein